MKKQKQEELPKGCVTPFIIGIIAASIFLVVKCNSWINSPAEKEQTDFSAEWSSMTYEERSEFLNQALDKRSFLYASELEFEMRKAIKKECANPTTVSFIISPSVYNGLANVVEADSGWIYTPFKCTAKNDFGVEKEIMGSVMFIYKPATNSLEVKQWDINQNN